MNEVSIKVLSFVVDNPKQFDRNANVTLVEEEVGDIFSLRRCRLCLELFHNEVREECAQRMQEVLVILLEREHEWDQDYFWCRSHQKRSVFRESRREDAKNFFKERLKIAKDDCDENPLRIIDIVQNDRVFQEFKEHWLLIPTLRLYRDELLPFFPKDIANKIVAM
jgi:hypothetical protein